MEMINSIDNSELVVPNGDNSCAYGCPGQIGCYGCTKCSLCSDLFCVDISICPVQCWCGING